MKKIYNLILLITSLLLGVTSCKIDNYSGPDAQVFGAIRDSVGGALVEQDLRTGSTIGVYELGEYATNPVLQSWAIKQNGEYRNDLVFSNTYKIEFQSCNFFPYIMNQIIFKPGSNEQDFLVTPFIRIKNATITNDVAGKKIIATFNLEAGKPTVKVSKITLYAFTDMFVGEYIKSNITTGTGLPSITFSPATTINPATVYSLSIDLAANASVFSIHRDYFFRVGAIASLSGVGTIRTNYAPYVKIAL